MAFNIYLTIPGIPGESANTYRLPGNSEAPIEVYAFSLGFSNLISIGSASTGAGAGKAQFSDLNITKQFDASSPKLFQTLVTGTHLATMTLSLVKAAGTAPASNTVFLTYKFNEVYVTSIQDAGSSGGDNTPTESISFAYGAINLSYTTQSSTGGPSTSSSASWNLTTNKAS